MNYADFEGTTFLNGVGFENATLNGEPFQVQVQEISISLAASTSFKPQQTAQAPSLKPQHRERIKPFIAGACGLRLELNCYPEQAGTEPQKGLRGKNQLNCYGFF